MKIIALLLHFFALVKVVPMCSNGRKKSLPHNHSMSIIIASWTVQSFLLRILPPLTSTKLTFPA